MAMQGWIKLHRQLMDDHYWLSEPFTRGQAWVDILLQTNHAPGFFRTANGKRVDVERGQCGMSQLTMASRWQWSRGRVKRFLNELEKDGNVVQQTVQQNSLLSVCNYERYQGPDNQDGTVDGTANDTTDGQLTDTKRDTNKNVKNGNNEKKGKKKHVYTETDFQSAQVMFQKLHDRYPNLKQPNLESWANDLRLMREVDKREPDQIADVFNFAIDHEFWSKNILSTSKFRKQFDRLLIEMDKPGKSSQKIQKSISATRRFLDAQR